MRTASILLALVVMLGFVREVAATTRDYPYRDCTVQIGQYRFGFTQWNKGEDFSLFGIGPLGPYPVPFSAVQGLIGFCCILPVLIVLPVVVLVTWRKKRVAV